MNFLKPTKKSYVPANQINDPFYSFFNFDDSYFDKSFFPSLKDTFSSIKESFTPAIDVSEDKQNVYVKADLPGLKKEDVSVELDNGLLKIRGERKVEEESKDKDYYRVERTYGSFQRVLKLHSSVNEANIKAKYKNGVLEVVIPKAEKSQSKAIEIEST